MLAFLKIKVLQGEWSQIKIYCLLASSPLLEKGKLVFQVFLNTARTYLGQIFSQL